MMDAGVSVIHGYHGEDQSVARLTEEAERIGYPVMIKAVRGGGGKGMRIAANDSEFLAQLESAKNEAMKSFNNDDMLLEKYIQEPRHVEVQVFGDQHGNYVYLYERDCSVQRRHQKIIEEAPAPGITAELRHRLGTEAVKAAHAVNYVGAGTVEFILDKNTNEYFFMEMNTRLQVEHPITEMITGTDLVEWQFKVANGEKLPLSQDEISLNGHSFEARIYAEDPSNNFLPGAGPLLHLSTPDPSNEVRIETGVASGDNISVYYDPMIAKLVVWGADRRQALLKFTDCLTKYNVAGLETNINFLLNLCRHKEFISGNVHTNFIPQYQSDLFPQVEMKDETVAFLALTQVYNEIIQNFKKKNQETHKSNDPFVTQVGFRINYNLSRNLQYVFNKKKLDINVEYLNKDVFRISYLNGNEQRVINVRGGFNEERDHLLITADINGRISKCKSFTTDEKIYVFTEDGCNSFEIPPPKYLSSTESSATAGAAVAPMPGVIDKIFAKNNQTVKTGEPLLVLIAMKMEYIIKAPKDGVIESVLFKVGDAVKKNTLLVRYVE